MVDLTPWYAAREHMRQALAEDLMGGPEEQELSERPLDRFIVGVLHPQDAGDLSAEDDEPESASGSGPDAAFDPAVALSRVQYPSSLGLTFSVDREVSSVVIVRASAARYVQRTAASNESSGEPRAFHRDRGRSGLDEAWSRESLNAEPIRLDVRTPGTSRFELTAGLSLRTIVRPPAADVVAVTVVLVNENRHSTGSKDALCWFQPGLALEVEEGEFVERSVAAVNGVDDEDLESYRLLFRHVRNLAVGHGCAVEWDPDAAVVTALRTTLLPFVDVPLAEPSGGLSSPLLMADLAERPVRPVLEKLVHDYNTWIGEREQEVDDLPEPLRTTAHRHLDQARRAAARIDAGMHILESDKTALLAFQLMNTAMQEQRTRQEYLRTGRVGAAPTSTSQAWRPFQMAFILLNLEGVTDPSSEDREVADVLWFPTGGGKTEAYLGLIAYTILLRRMRNPQDAGVSVLMRYTLRLLTVQQFERAAGLICALETVRRRELVEAAPISLGLWVGQGATPNSVSDAAKALRSLSRGEEGEEGNPMQLLRCPWCGAQLGSEEYRIDAQASRMTVRCADASCPFGDQLPVYMVDEDVYRERPSLVIGTVDKFAMMAWRGEVGALFSTDGANSAPDLIVQDELHLISGPLGTMVGLYEAAVDAACSRPHRPKVVASTATIRRAAQQVRAVFDRRAEQFPPPGLSVTDSFFAVEAAREAKGTRQYVGVLAPGVSQATLLVRAYAALLQAARTLPAEDAVRDAYWTLLGYFNSLRVLGGAYIQVIDDVTDRLKVVAERAGQEGRVIGEPRELTSRRRSSEIPRELAILSTALPDPGTPDVVLATNMISVGVDVDRLGLMVVMGQPQTTAEYIQATSRVGRQRPGLVVVLYNGARSRDLSHYETFAAYHQGLYRQVEATGATPFAPRARDRGLHGVLVSMARLLIAGATAEAAAADVGAWRNELHAVAEEIIHRAARVAPESVAGLRHHLGTLMDQWQEAASGRPIHYAGWFSAADALLTQAGTIVDDQETSFPVTEAPWPTLTSLREVDAESWLHLVPSGKAVRHGA